MFIRTGLKYISLQQMLGLFQILLQLILLLQLLLLLLLLLQLLFLLLLLLIIIIIIITAIVVIIMMMMMMIILIIHYDYHFTIVTIINMISVNKKEILSNIINKSLCLSELILHILETTQQRSMPPVINTVHVTTTTLSLWSEITNSRFHWHPESL